MSRTLALIAPLLLLAGCATSSSTPEKLMVLPMPVPPPATSPDGLPPTQPLREVVHFDIELFQGDVVIEADPSLKELKVSMTRESHHGVTRVNEAKDALEAIGASAETVDDERGRTLRIRASTTHPEQHFQKANIHIKAPAVGDVRIRTRRGQIELTDIQGTVDIETSDEDVIVMTNWPMTQPVTILTSRGDIDYRVRAESTGAFDAHSLGGKVLFRQRYGRWLMKDAGSTRDRVVATLNGGENPITLRTVNGMIRVAVVHDPVAEGTFIVDP